MWQCCKHHLGLPKGCVIRPDVGNVGCPEPRVLPALFVGGGKDKLERGVAYDQATQLSPGVTAGTEDSYRNFMHKECITLHWFPVNDSRTILALTAQLC